MKTRAAVLWEAGGDWRVEEVELDEPKAHEVRVRLVAAGLCHSEEHYRRGDVPFTPPIIGGHEGAGVVEAIGSAVQTVAPGDHVVFTSMPSCGRCAACACGQQNLCDVNRFIGEGWQLADHTARHHVRGADVKISCLLGVYAEHTVVNEMSVIPIDRNVPLDRACIVGCGVPTGWGSMVYTGGARGGDDVAVVGVGGLGSAAVQGARMTGARHIFAIEPNEWKQQKAREFGATHTAGSIEEAYELVREVTWGRMCAVVVLTMGLGDGELMADAVALAGKRGRIVVANTHRSTETHQRLSMLDLARYEKQIVGSILGSTNTRRDIPRLIDDYLRGALDLDGMVTTRYPLDAINEGYADMHAGKNIRGVLTLGEA